MSEGKHVFYPGLHPDVEAKINPLIFPDDLKFTLLKDSFYEGFTFFCFDEAGGVLFIQLVLSSIGLHTNQPGILLKYTDGDGNITKYQQAGKFGDITWQDHYCGLSFYGNDILYDENNNCYNIKAGDSTISIDLKFTQTVEGYKINNGKVYLGEEKQHYLYQSYIQPRSKVEGTLKLNGQESKMNGFGYVGRVQQNIKPHKCAITWHLLKFPAKNGSINITQFETPKEYGLATVSNVVVTDNEKIIAAGVSAIVNVEESHHDSTSGYNPPDKYSYTCEGANLVGDGNYSAKVSIESKKLFERTDILAQLPWVIRTIIQAFISKPWGYTWWDDVKATINIDGQEPMVYEGKALHEVMFVNPHE